MRTSTNYRFTLPVEFGNIIDVANQYANLCAYAQQLNDRPFRRGRWVVEKKFRGPRAGNRYMTPRANAHSVDIYLRERKVW